MIETLAIGDELLTGKISDTNSTFVADELFKTGLTLKRQTVVADVMEEIEAAVRDCASRADIVVCFGGLGPTSDDRTAECIAKILNCKLAEHGPSKEKLLKYLKERNRELTPQSLKQILFPEKSVALENTVGQAPGFSFKLGKCTFFFLPGVPNEMKAMFTQSVLPKIQELSGGTSKILSHVWRCLEIPESELQRQMDPVEASLPKNAWLGYRTRFPENHLSLYWKGDSIGFKETTEKIRAILKPWTYTEGDSELETLILNELKERKRKIVFAESVTGGLAVQRLTNIPGASISVVGGYTPYQVGAKEKMLGVKLASEAEAVSAECTRQLAEAAKKETGADIAAAITGYIDSGTLYLCVVGEKVFEKKILQVWRNRKEAQWGAATHLLNLAYKTIKQSYN